MLVERQRHHGAASPLDGRRIVDIGWHGDDGPVVVARPGQGEEDFAGAVADDDLCRPARGARRPGPRPIRRFPDRGNGPAARCVGQERVAEALRRAQRIDAGAEVEDRGRIAAGPGRQRSQIAAMSCRHGSPHQVRGQRAKVKGGHDFHDFASGAEGIAGGAAELAIDIGGQEQRRRQAGGRRRSGRGGLPTAATADDGQQGQSPRGRPPRAAAGRKWPPARRGGLRAAGPGACRSPPARPAASARRPATAEPAPATPRRRISTAARRQRRSRPSRPTWLSFMISSIRSRLRQLRKPSAVSDRPSRCRQPEKLSMATTSTAAATSGGAAVAKAPGQRGGRHAQQQADDGKKGHAAGQVRLGRAPSARQWHDGQEVGWPPAVASCTWPWKRGLRRTWRFR